MKVKLILGSILFLIILCLKMNAQQWKSLGLEKEFISAIAVNSTNPEIIYAGSFSDFSANTVGGIFRTTNGGAQWDTLIRGVTVRDIDINPKNPEIIYAALGANALTRPGIIKSTDGGNNWIKADSGISTSWEVGASVLVINPKHPDTLYAGTAGFWQGLPYKSTNGGFSWSRLNMPPAGSITCIALDPKNSEHLYWGTDFNGYLYETSDGGITWDTTGLTEKGIIYDVLVDPDSSEKLYAGTYKFGFFYSNDGGRTWIQNNTGLNDTVSVLKIQFHKGNSKTSLFINAGASDGIYLLNKNFEWENYGNVGSWFIQIVDNKIYAGSYAGIYLSEELTSVSNKFKQPTSIFLYQNYPNPFNCNTCISYKLNGDKEITINIYDILGKKIKTIFQGRKTIGEYIVNWDGKNDQGNVVSTGFYICTINTTSELYKLKMLYLK
jgi:photosystem II stability/assembly factor-like uncharacterized protein